MIVTDVIDYVRRSTLNMTNLNTTLKRKGRSELYHIVENDFSTSVTTEWKLGCNEVVQLISSVEIKVFQFARTAWKCQHDFSAN